MEKVIVAITTFNLDEYIAQALDSILMQKTRFAFKILVADDCSTDNTLPILSEYAKKYPSIIEVRTTDKNLGSLANSNRLFDGIDCEYLSFLDGDDYWLDENRLQKQVDFLDAHPSYALCGANTRLLKHGVLSETMIPEEYLGKSFSFEDFVKGTMPYVHTSSIVLRNTIFRDGLPSVFGDAVGTFEECALRGEDFRRIIHLYKGPIYLMNDCFSVYRIHARGIWQGSSPLKKQIEVAIADNFHCKYFGDQFEGHFIKRAEVSYRRVLSTVLCNNLEGKCLSPSEANLVGPFLTDYNLNHIDSPARKSPLRRMLLALIRKAIHRVS